MNILELFEKLMDVCVKEFDVSSDGVFFDYLDELLLCAEAQGWVKVGEPDDVLFFSADGTNNSLSDEAKCKWYLTISNMFLKKPLVLK